MANSFSFTERRAYRAEHGEPDDISRRPERAGDLEAVWWIAEGPGSLLLHHSAAGRSLHLRNQLCLLSVPHKIVQVNLVKFVLST